MTAGVREYRSVVLPTESFGGEILATEDNERDGIGCYSEDETTHKFTGKERDSESKLDYFGVRYFSWASGRFNSADEPLMDQEASDPQSWNLYGYGRNNPLRYSDPTGGKCIRTDDGSMADEGSGGGCDAAGVEPSGRIKPQAIEVEGIAPPSPLLLAVAQGAQQAKPVVDALAIATTAFAGGAMIGSAIPVGIETVGLNSPWLLGWAARGLAISNTAGANLPQAFKGIDKFENGVATSIKSIDLSRATYLDPAKLLSLINRYVSSISNFQGARYRDVRIGEAVRGVPIQQKVLEIVIPPGATPAQHQAIQSAAAQAVQRGVVIRTVIMR